MPLESSPHQKTSSLKSTFFKKDYIPYYFIIGIFVRFAIYIIWPQFVDHLAQRNELAYSETNKDAILEWCWSTQLCPSFFQDIIPLLNIFSDLAASWAIYLFAVRFGHSEAQCILVSVFYFCNPVSILSSLSGSLSHFINLFILFGLFFATLNNSFGVFMCLVGFSYFVGSLFPIMLFVPYYKPKSVKLSILLMVLSFSGMFLLSDTLFDAFDHIDPNLGTGWYLFAQVFTQVSILFKTVYLIFPYFFVVPLQLHINDRFRLATLYFLLWSLIRLFPVAVDFVWIGCLVLLQKDVELKSGFFLYFFLYVASILSPVQYNLWIYESTGNANFFFACGFGLSVTVTMFIIDLTFAHFQYVNPKSKTTNLKKIQ